MDGIPQGARKAVRLPGGTKPVAQELV